MESGLAQDLFPLLHTLSQLYHPFGVLLQSHVFVRFRLPVVDLGSTSLLIECHEYDNALRGFGVSTFFQIAGAPRRTVYPRGTSGFG